LARKTTMDMVTEAKSQIENLDCAAMAAEQEDGALIVDIREQVEREQQGVIPGAVHVPRGLLEFIADPASPMHNQEFELDRRIVLHCATGGRSALAAVALKDLGFTNVAHGESGFTGWSTEGRPVEKIEALWDDTSS
jgi:rhodanese-related sulfurtransferase